MPARSAALGSFHVKSWSTGEVPKDVFGNGLGDDPCFALLLNCDLLPVHDLVGIDLLGPLIQRKQIVIDADLHHEALVERLAARHCLAGLVLHRIGRVQRRHVHGWSFEQRLPPRAGQNDRGHRRMGHACITAIDHRRRIQILGARPTEVSKPCHRPTGESDGSAQRRQSRKSTRSHHAPPGSP